MINALTVDVEEYFHVMAFAKVIDPSGWDQRPSRVEWAVQRILQLFHDGGVQGTFFVLGWLAERHSSLIREIASEGHEIASHGYGHRLVSGIGKEGFRDDIRRSRNILEDIIGKKVDGYRAPSYSITRDCLWAFDVLVEEGYSYDSSLFPIRHDLGGMPGAARFPHVLKWENGEIVEFPLSTVKIGPLVLPVAGGGYLRLVPAWMTSLGINRINACDRQPAAVYFHPWEIDPDQPRVRCSAVSRFRHYQNLHSTFRKIGTLIETFRFSPMKDILDGMKEDLPSYRL